MLSTLLFSLLACLPALSPDAQTVISDGDFENWSEEIDDRGLLSIVGGRSVGRGNPGNAYLARYAGNFVMWTVTSSIAAWDESQRFDISVNGAIQNLTFQFDLRHEALTIPLSLIEVYPMVRQGGETYVALSQKVSPPSDNVWYAHGPFATLPDESSFSRVVGSGFDSSRPDFSIAGSPIAFGFYAVGETEPFVSKDSDLYVDNFSVSFDTTITLTQTPLQRDLVTVFTLRDAFPFEVAYFYLSTTGLGVGPCLPQFGGVCLDILSPTFLLGYSLSDSFGTARLLVMVPTNAPLISVYTQAIIWRGVGGAESALTNTVTGTVLP